MSNEDFWGGGLNGGSDLVAQVDSVEVGVAPAPFDDINTVAKPVKKLTAQQVKIVNYIEQAYWTEGIAPTPEAIATALGIYTSSVKLALSEARVIDAIQRRGIEAPDLKATQLTGEKTLTPQQLLLANMLLNIHDKRTIREKLKEIDISQQKYNAWMRSPTFTKFLTRRGEELFKSHDHAAYMGLVKAVSSGDVNALKLFFEMRGIYQPRLQIDIDINAVILRVVEVVSRHVTDKDTLLAIASDIEGLLPNTSPVGKQVIDV